MTAAEVREKLAAVAHPGGGWGYQPGQPAHLEPTCLGLLALTADPERYAAALAAGWRAVRSHARADGSYRLTRGRPRAVWPTAMVLFARAVTGTPVAELTATADRLLTIEGKVLKADPEIAEMLDIDVRLMGWPWAEDTFSWVEPTSWACLALRRVGRGGETRVAEGLRMLLDRAFDTGGANYGNRTVLGRLTEPIPGPTAAFLLAAQGIYAPRVEAAKGYLRTHGEQTTDLEHLAWIRIALTCHATDAATRTALPTLDARVRESLAVERTAPPGLSAGPPRLALAALALDAERRNPFALTDAPTVGRGDPAFADRADGGGVSMHEARSAGERVGAFFRGLMVRGRQKQLPLTSPVHIARVDSYDVPLLPVLKEQFEHFRGMIPPVAGKRVLLKPNLVEYHRHKVINTDPRVVEAVIELFQAEGAGEIVVAEGPGHWRNVQYLVNASGLGDVLRRQGVRFVDLNHDEPCKTMNLGRTTGLEFLYLSKTVLTADVFVSLPKLKTHHWTGATLSLKNLFGTLPGICYGWPKNELHWRGIPNSIVDIALTHTPHLAIVDGIVGMEGDGPLNGRAKPLGAIVMGADLVAVDATCCRLMRLPPERVPTLRLAADRKLGHLTADKVVQLGEPIDALATAFELPPGIEKLLISEPAVS